MVRAEKLHLLESSEAAPAGRAQSIFLFFAAAERAEHETSVRMPAKTPAYRALLHQAKLGCVAAVPDGMRESVEATSVCHLYSPALVSVL